MFGRIGRTWTGCGRTVTQAAPCVGQVGRIFAKKDALLFGRRLTEMGKSGKKWGEVGRGGVKFLEKVCEPPPASSICKIIF